MRPQMFACVRANPVDRKNVPFEAVVVHHETEVVRAWSTDAGRMTKRRCIACGHELLELGEWDGRI